MKNFLRKLAVENRKLAFYLAALAALGVFAFMLARYMPAGAEGPVGMDLLSQGNILGHTGEGPGAEPLNHSDFARESALEARLEAFFALVEGAGKVRVMISPFAGRETVFAVDVNKSEALTTETDGQGGARETRQQQSQEKTVMVTDRQGTDRPLILREIEPAIGGVVIIAQGGDNPMVRDALTRAARAVLGLDAHQIQILKGDF